jgi:AraC family transcriptional regulator, regulatory protein of adaptative response / methylated-DNA-[protein]-cysteine methyltransferase
MAPSFNLGLFFIMFELMNNTKNNFELILKAISFNTENEIINNKYKSVFAHLNIDEESLNKIFIEWCGKSFSNFELFTSAPYLKYKLQKNQPTLFSNSKNDVEIDTQLPQDFIVLLPMQSDECKNGGEHLHINYCFAETHFGEIIIAHTKIGICHVALIENESKAIEFLTQQFPKATYTNEESVFKQKVIDIFNNKFVKNEKIILHVNGTAFQFKVWGELLKIALGELISYGTIANNLGNPNASRAVGTAIGDNPIAYLLPCHRVVQANGTYGGYMWGIHKKMAILGWEAAKTEN